LRTRYPGKSRVQRLYFNTNTITIGAILTLCTAMRVQSTVIHVVLNSVTEGSEPKGVCISFLGQVVTVAPLGSLGGGYQATAVIQLVLRVGIFLLMRSMVQWKKNDTAVRKRLKQSGIQAQKQTRKIK